MKSLKFKASVTALGILATSSMAFGQIWTPDEKKVPNTDGKRAVVFMNEPKNEQQALTLLQTVSAVTMYGLAGVRIQNSAGADNPIYPKTTETVFHKGLHALSMFDLYLTHKVLELSELPDYNSKLEFLVVPLSETDKAEGQYRDLDPKFTGGYLKRYMELAAPLYDQSIKVLEPNFQQNLLLKNQVAQSVSDDLLGAFPHPNHMGGLGQLGRTAWLVNSYRPIVAHGRLLVAKEKSEASFQVLMPPVGHLVTRNASNQVLPMRNWDIRPFVSDLRNTPGRKPLETGLVTFDRIGYRERIKQEELGAVLVTGKKDFSDINALKLQIAFGKFNAKKDGIIPVDVNEARNAILASGQLTIKANDKHPYLSKLVPAANYFLNQIKVTLAIHRLGLKMTRPESENWDQALRRDGYSIDAIKSDKDATDMSLTLSVPELALRAATLPIGGPMVLGFQCPGKVDDQRLCHLQFKSFKSTQFTSIGAWIDAQVMNIVKKLAQGQLDDEIKRSMDQADTRVTQGEEFVKHLAVQILGQLQAARDQFGSVIDSELANEALARELFSSDLNKN